MKNHSTFSSIQWLFSVCCLALLLVFVAEVEASSAATNPKASTVSDASALAQAANQVVPGQWFHFTAAENSGWNGGALLNLGPTYNGSDNATPWSSKASWNPVTEEFFFTGGGHGCCGTHSPDSEMILRYRVADNLWSATYHDGVHTYESATINTSAGANNNLYHRLFGSNTVGVYSIAHQKWEGDLASVPSPSRPDCCLALEYFPDRDSLITIDNDWGIFEYSFSSGRWSGCVIGTTQPGCGAIHPMCGSSSTASPWARYDQAHHRMLFGGCTNVYALSPSMQVAQLASAPFPISVGPSGSPVSIDPQTGQLVSWDASGNTFTSDGANWINSGASPFPDPVHNGLACASVSTYRVIMCFYAGTSSRPVTNGSVWLYKVDGVSHGSVSKAASIGRSVPVPTSAPAASTTSVSISPLARSSHGANGWSDRSAGTNVPGGAASVVGIQSFDTFPVTNRQQYFKLYDPASITTDCSIAADGCSLKFAILKGYRQGEPGWFDWNFSPDLSRTFGNGQEFYVQYRERLDPGMLKGSNFPNGEGFKHNIITEGDTSAKVAGDCSNSPGEVVLIQDGNGAPYPGLYHNCGFSGGSLAFMQRGYQLIQLDGIAANNFLDQNAAGCPHYAGRGIPATDPTCFNYVANEWFTVQIHIKAGTFNQPDSVLDVWLAHEGKPAQLIVNAADAALVNDSSGGTSARYGKIQLSAYNTGMSGSLVDTAVWFDDLIVTTRRIPDPDVGTPNAPDSLSVSHATSAGITVNWRVNSQNGTPQDDAGFLVERCTGDGAACFPNPQKGFTQIGVTKAGESSFVDHTVARGHTYTYRVRARNNAGTSGYAAAQCFNRGPDCGGTVVAP